MLKRHVSLDLKLLHSQKWASFLWQILVNPRRVSESSWPFRKFHERSRMSEHCHLCKISYFLLEQCWKGRFHLLKSSPTATWKFLNFSSVDFLYFNLSLIFFSSEVRNSSRLPQNHTVISQRVEAHLVPGRPPRAQTLSPWGVWREQWTSWMMNSTCLRGWSPLSGRDWCKPGGRKSRASNKYVCVYFNACLPNSLVVLNVMMSSNLRNFFWPIPLAVNCKRPENT